MLRIYDYEENKLVFSREPKEDFGMEKQIAEFEKECNCEIVFSHFNYMAEDEKTGNKQNVFSLMVKQEGLEEQKQYVLTIDF